MELSHCGTVGRILYDNSGLAFPPPCSAPRPRCAASTLCVAEPSHARLQPLGAAASLRGTALRPAAARAAPLRAAVAAPVAELERLRLHNLSPEEGSRHRKARVGRGHSAGQARALHWCPGRAAAGERAGWRGVGLGLKR